MRQPRDRITTDDLEDGSVTSTKLAAGAAPSSVAQTFASAANESDDLVIPAPFPAIGRLFVTLAAGNANWTGLSGGVDGLTIILKNIDPSNTLTLNSESTNSQAAHRFNGVGDATIPPGNSVMLVYTAGTRNRWDVH